MREIKFRAWNKEEKEMEFFKMSDFFDVMFYTCGYIFREFIFMQFTGLKDKNGKEIYEGDIIGRYKDRYGKYHESCLKVVEWLKTTGWNGFNIVDSKNMKWEVLGNIYSNPELLNKPK